MHAPPSAWPQHHTHLDAPALNFTHSDAHTLKFSSQPQPLGRAHLPQLLDEALPTNLPPLDATHTHAHNDDTHTRTHARRRRGVIDSTPTHTQRRPARPHARTHTDNVSSFDSTPHSDNDDMHGETTTACAHTGRAEAVAALPALASFTSSFSF
jgi:hypothetical protein